MISAFLRTILPARRGDRAALDPACRRALAPAPGHCVYAVGDVHGQVGQLRAMVAAIAARAQDDRARGEVPVAVFLGDYIDRGDDSRAVLDLLCDLPQAEPTVRWVFLAGNHEASVLGFLDDPQTHAPWLRFGGIETMASYGVPPAAAETLRQSRDRLAQALPDRHLDFLRGLRHSYESGDYVFVHAGLRPGVPLAQQRAEDLLWIRDEFLGRPCWHGKCVVHGHTIEPEPAVLEWRMGIDTGAYAGGALTCLALRSGLRELAAVPPQGGPPDWRLVAVP
ncbi:metallophosphoesterase family protein [Magnetospirillum sp. 64-120]|uniref:metallophosphoesterase family protein n=1 Tax=Magnetospirillum sp. 64-120 TaxID=1895778 RepID=UPI000A7B2C20|nr:metallophosphoesterase family protein [Magnetospirillum sp. 64-120]